MDNTTLHQNFYRSQFYLHLITMDFLLSMVEQGKFLCNPHQARMRSEGYCTVCVSVCLLDFNLVNISRLERLFVLKTLLHTQRAAKVKMILKPLSCRHPAFPTLYGYPTSANMRKNAHAHLSTGAAQYGCIKASNGWSRKNQTKHHSSRCNRHFNAHSLGGRHKHAPPKQVLPDEEVSCEVIFWQETSSTGSTIEEIDDLESIIVEYSDQP